MVVCFGSSVQVGMAGSIWVLFFSRILVGLVKQVRCSTMFMSLGVIKHSRLHTMHETLRVHPCVLPPYLPPHRAARPSHPSPPPRVLHDWQTMTLSTAILSDQQNLTRSERTEHLSRLSAAATVAYIIGSAMGSYLYRQSPLYPPFSAAAANILAALVVLVTLRHESVAGPHRAPSVDKANKSEDRPTTTLTMLGRLRNRLRRTWANVKETLDDSVRQTFNV